MQRWEYKIFASHLDPAELVVILDECGREGWELVALAAVADCLKPCVILANRQPTQGFTDPSLRLQLSNHRARIGHRPRLPVDPLVAQTLQENG